MDVFNSNRSRLNTSRINDISTRNLIFHLASLPEQGPSSIEIPFPQYAAIHSVTANCASVGSIEMTFNLESCPAYIYGTQDEEWEVRNETPFTFKRGEKLIATGTNITNIEIDAGTYFRIHILNAADVGDITVSVQCVVENEESINREG